jgi:LysM repeat protein
MIRYFFLSIFLILFTSSFAQQKELFAKGQRGNLYIEHRVSPKENWYSIGRTYALSPKDIAPYNQLSLDMGLGIGQVIKIPLLATNFDQQSNTAIGIPVYHKVQPKEGLFRITENYGIALNDLKRINKLNSDQVKIGDMIIIGFLRHSEQTVVPSNSAASDKDQNTIATNSKVPNSATVQSNIQATPVTKSSDLKKSEAKQETKKEITDHAAAPTASSQIAPGKLEKMGSGFFSSLYDQQSNEGKQQHLEAFIYGVFKSTSGWDDQKYYVLLNDVVPGTAIKISVKDSERFVYAKVLGAVPPGKESEGLSMRMSNATAAALGLTDTNAQLTLDWYK